MSLVIERFDNKLAYLGNDITNSTSEDPVEFSFNNLITQVTLELSLKMW